MVTLHEVITFLVSMQISISSLQTHNVNRCGRDRKSGSAGMPRPISYAVFCLKKKKSKGNTTRAQQAGSGYSSDARFSEKVTARGTRTARESDSGSEHDECASMI